jgi:hypothetical protein
MFTTEWQGNEDTYDNDDEEERKVLLGALSSF